MANETRAFSGATLIELSAGCDYFETYGQSNVLVNEDPDNAGQYLVTMDSALWATEESNYVAPDYPPV